MKVIGVSIKPLNKGDIWEKGKDGLYRCINNKMHENRALSQEQVDSDLINGFVEVLKESQ